MSRIEDFLQEEETGDEDYLNDDYVETDPVDASITYYKVHCEIVECPFCKEHIKITETDTDLEFNDGESYLQEDDDSYRCYLCLNKFTYDELDKSALIKTFEDTFDCNGERVDPEEIEDEDGLVDDSQGLLEQIVSMLGTDSESTWTEFMRFLDEKMPFLMSKGRPTKIEIKESIVGLYSFDSFKTMCNEKTENSGLGWNYNTYRLWKKSWSLVKKHPFLIALNLSASEINTMFLDCSKNNIEFPLNEDEFKKYKELSKSAIKDAATKTNNQNIKELLDAKAQISMLQSQIQDNDKLKLDNATLSSKNESLEHLLNENKKSSEKLERALNEQIANLTKTHELLEINFQKKVKTSKSQSKKLIQYKNMGFFKRLFNYTVTI